MERLLKLRLSIVLVAVLGWTFLPFFFGSRSQHLIDRWVPRQDSLADQHDVDLLRQRDFEPLEKEFDPELANSDVQSSLSYMASMFPAEQPITVKVVDVSFARGPESKGVSLTFEYQFSKEWLLAHLDTRSQNGVRTITGFQVKEMETSLESANRFTLANKGSSQYAALLLQILDLGFSFYGFALCLQVIAGWKKWLWAAGTLVGVGQLSPQLVDRRKLLHSVISKISSGRCACGVLWPLVHLFRFTRGCRSVFRFAREAEPKRN